MNIENNSRFLWFGFTTLLVAYKTCAIKSNSPVCPNIAIQRCMLHNKQTQVPTSMPGSLFSERGENLGTRPTQVPNGT